MKSNIRNLFIGFALSIVLAAGLMGCGGAVTALPATSAPTIQPTDTALPTQTPVPLYQVVTLTSVAYTDGSTTAPAYTVTAQTPTLQGSDDPRVTNFNNEMIQLQQEEIARFKDNARMAIDLPDLPGSSYDQKYELLSSPGNLLSLKFEIYIYIEGAAHPSTYSRTVTYDLETGADIHLDQFFLFGSDYLETIANYCIAQLQTRNIGFEAFTAGAEPVPENYGNWNITPDGLLITFDEDQVAAHAAGPQLVVIPYTELQAVIDPSGPLGSFLQ